MPTENYYSILGIKPTATKAEVKKAYRKLAKKYHPDVSKEQDAEAHFKKIVEAYDVLKNKNKRQLYDVSGENPKSAKSSTHFKGVDLSIFADLFSKGAFGKKEEKPRESTPVSQNIVLQIDLEDIARGANKQIKLGTKKIVNIKIPKGIEEGRVIRLMKRADTGGDLLVKIKVKPHKQFKHKGKNLFTEITVSLDNNNLPTTLEIPTLNKPITIKTPEGLKSSPKSEHKIRLKGYGLPSNPSTPLGDMFVTIRIKKPLPAQLKVQENQPEKPKRNNQYQSEQESLLQDLDELSQILKYEENTQYGIDFLLQELSRETVKLMTEADKIRQQNVMTELQNLLDKMQHQIKKSQ